MSSATPPIESCLIVDDHEGMRRLLRDLLSPWAISIAESENGVDAIADYLSHSPQLVLMDIEMPEMDGILATKTILRIDPEARVVIITQHDSQEIRSHSAEIGALACLPKLELSHLGSQLKSIVKTCSYPR